MRTLIELYDERPIENVLAAHVFRPERTVFVCESSIAENTAARRAIEGYFRHCGVNTEVIMLPSNRYSVQGMLDTLRKAAETYDDCVLDITGGTDQALFAAGMLYSEKHIPAFTWARRSNTFYPLSGAPFEHPLENTLSLRIEDFFVMAGGSVRKGRVDNAILGNYLGYFEPFFDIYLKYKKGWTTLVGWMQRASAPENGVIQLCVNSPITVKGDRGPVTCSTEVLTDLQKLGFIQELQTDEERVSFRFADAQVRAWLRDIGSVLETYVYKVCLDTGIFSDVATSVIADWESGVTQNGVSNEIDVMAVRGVTPLFISCKTCDIKTEALNELAVLKDRFGGEMARAAVVSASNVQTITRRRAHELGIEVIDIDDLKNGRTAERIKLIAK